MDNLFLGETKCVKTNKTFYTRFDKATGGVWCQTYGVRFAQQSTTGSTYNKMEIDILKSTASSQYKCPNCGNIGYIRCGTCGKITCKHSNTKDFTCAHCGKTGVVNGVIKGIGGSSGMGQG